ncbi:MAG: heavy-metal-associated domain-containing protein [Nanoarchaeota archaeon]|nr:heavy-metal-associated domain-containing protein [Nanoarchaeota archaeon]MBU1622575.1 heavy-metal-associated domain-containing protein [Nanoarchaeota archaeon]MBU1974239.1 heavy-metal-associated domain-containing protein [Nanoarchaeota archaeon]
MKTAIFRVDGIHCHSCEILISDALEDLGVKKSKADKDKGIVRVDFDDRHLTPNRIRDGIEEEGYKVMMQKIIN